MKSQFCIALLLLPIIIACKNTFAPTKTNPAEFLGAWKITDTVMVNDSVKCFPTLIYYFSDQRCNSRSFPGPCSNGTTYGESVIGCYVSWYVQENQLLIGTSQYTYHFINDSCLELKTDSIDNVFIKTSN